MQGFEFQDVVVFTIAGKEFRMRIDDGTKAFIEGLREQSALLGDQILKKEKPEAEAIEFCRDVMDKILGAGAFQTIFSGREATLRDICAVIAYMAKVIKAHTFKSVLPEAIEKNKKSKNIKEPQRKKKNEKS